MEDKKSLKGLIDKDPIAGPTVASVTIKRVGDNGTCPSEQSNYNVEIFVRNPPTTYSSISLSVWQPVIYPGAPQQNTVQLTNINATNPVVASVCLYDIEVEPVGGVIYQVNVEINGVIAGTNIPAVYSI